MKKKIAVFLMISLLISALAGCSGAAADTQTEKTVRLGGLKGPTSMGMVKLLEDAEQGISENTYAFTMAGSADELTAGIMKGDLDILAVPVNLASVLYQKSAGEIRLLAVNTLGILYIVEKGGQTVTDMKDLKGKTIYATGKGSTPEYTLFYLLNQNGIDPETDVTVLWKNEPTEIVAAMGLEETALAMIPQPYATVAQTQIPDLRVALDLTQQWQKANGAGQCLTAGLIVRADFAQKNPDAVKTFLKEYAASAAYVNENPAEAAVLIEKQGIVKAAIAQKAIPQCNIVCITGNEMKDAAAGYLGVLYAQNPASVGGKLPGEDFYQIYE